MLVKPGFCWHGPAAFQSFAMTARFQRRLVRHHLPLALLCLASGWLLYATRPYTDVITKLSFATAYPALFLLCLTLAFGPFKQLMGQRLATSHDLRRDIGIWAGILGLLHTGLGQFVHLRGRPWLYYIHEDWQAKGYAQPLRTDLFGFNNDTGLLAALLLLMLAATSNDASLRRLGTPGWKKLQRWNYACFALTAAHTFGYQSGGGRGGFLIASIAAVAATLLLQGIGWQQRRAQAA